MSDVRLQTPAVGVLAIAVVATIVGYRWNTFAAGGSDSHCYLQQARSLASGTTVLREPLGLRAPWPAADLTFAPAGFIPSSVEAGASVPICPPGFALALAPFVFVSSILTLLDGSVGERLPFVVVPLFGGWAVWLTWVIGRRVGGVAVGLAAAALIACSPVFLYQIVQPMSDVPAAALWLAAIVALTGSTENRSTRSGLAAGCALLVRPNLVPLAMVLGAFATLVSFRATGWRGAVAAATRFAGGLLPGVLLILVLQWHTYGSPLQTGYGDLGRLFAVEHVVPNLRHYLEWLYATHGPVLGLALFAPFVTRDTAAHFLLPSGGDFGPRWLTALSLVFVAVTLGCYLPYVEFDVWWYLRFLLPAIPLLLVLVVATLWSALRWARSLIRGVVMAVAVTTIGTMWLRSPEAGLALQLHRLERHFVDAGHVTRRLPETAVVLTVADSGGVRFHGRRSTLLWESLDPAWFDRALEALRQQGRPPYLLLEASEVEAFKGRFRDRTAIAELDWPPTFQVGTAMLVYDPADRARFFGGARVATERLWSPVPAAPRAGLP
jgi:hypothetical protein